MINGTSEDGDPFVDEQIDTPMLGRAVAVVIERPSPGQVIRGRLVSLDVGGEAVVDTAYGRRHCWPALEVRRERRLLLGRWSLYVEPRDLWVGVYYDDGAVYICPVPCIVFRYERRRKT